MSGEEFDALPLGSTAWFLTGIFTASRVTVLDKDGQGATRRLWVQVIDHAPGQPSTSDINGGRGLPVSYRSVRCDT